jgi:hypothetical protein
MVATVFQGSFTVDDSGDEGESFRNITGTAGLSSTDLGQVRVIFEASSASGNFTVDHAAIAVDDNSGSGSSLDVPKELLFGASSTSGFNIVQGTTLVSNWLNSTLLWTSTFSLMVIEDINAVSGGAARRGTPAGTHVFIKPSTQSFNLKTVTGYAESGFLLGISRIETQAPSGGGPVIAYRRTRSSLGTRGGSRQSSIAAPYRPRIIVPEHRWV